MTTIVNANAYVLGRTGVLIVILLAAVACGRERYRSATPERQAMTRP